MGDQMDDCWVSRQDDVEERFGYGSREYWETYAPEWVDGMCLLESGHEGPHEFTPLNEIMISRAEVPHG